MTMPPSRGYLPGLRTWRYPMPRLAELTAGLPPQPPEADLFGSLEQAVRQGPDHVSSALQQIEGGVPVVVNSAGYGDLTAFVLGLLDAEARGKRFLYRTAASFVRVRAGQAARPLLSPAEIYAASGAGRVSEWG